LLAVGLIVVGILTSVIAIFDKMLSDPQRKWITDRWLKLWYVLDEARRGSFVSFLKRRWVRVLTIVGGVLYPVYVVGRSFLEGQTATFNLSGYGNVTVPRDATFNDFMNELPDHVYVIIFLGLVGVVSNFTISRLFRGSNAGFVKTSIISIVAFVAISKLLNVLSLNWVRQYDPDGFYDIIFTVSDVVFSAAGFIILFPAAVFLLLLILLYVVEFVVRRIAEQPAGPLATVGGLLTAAGALLKTFA